MSVEVVSVEKVEVLISMRDGSGFSYEVTGCREATVDFSRASDLGRFDYRQVGRERVVGVTFDLSGSDMKWVSQFHEPIANRQGSEGS